VPIEQKVDLLLRANAEALKVPGARFVNSAMFLLKQEKSFASTEGSYLEQTYYRAYPAMTVTAVAPDFSDFQSRQSTDIAPRGMGYEHVRDARMVENAGRWAQEAVAKLSAKAVQPGRYDLVLLPTHLWLTIHESIAHPTELDRIMGFEANYAGTSFVSPPADFLGKFRYGPEFMNIQGERSTPGTLSATGWDDEGVKPDEFLIIRNGVVNDLQTTREQAPWLADWYRQQGRPVRSHGNSYAQSWADVQFQRMPNVNLMADPAKDTSVEELGAGVQGDQGREDHRPAEGRRLPDAHPRVLELDGRHRRPQHLLHRRIVLRRQGAAQPGERRQPRLARGPLPPGQRHQHRTQGLTCPPNSSRARRPRPSPGAPSPSPPPTTRG